MFLAVVYADCTCEGTNQAPLCYSAKFSTKHSASVFLVPVNLQPEAFPPGDRLGCRPCEPAHGTECTRACPHTVLTQRPTGSGGSLPSTAASSSGRWAGGGRGRKATRAHVLPTGSQQFKNSSSTFLRRKNTLTGHSWHQGDLRLKDSHNETELPG